MKSYFLLTQKYFWIFVEKLLYYTNIRHVLNFTHQWDLLNSLLELLAGVKKLINVYLNWHYSKFTWRANTVLNTRSTNISVVFITNPFLFRLSTTYIVKQIYRMQFHFCIDIRFHVIMLFIKFITCYCVDVIPNKKNNNMKVGTRNKSSLIW